MPVTRELNSVPPAIVTPATTGIAYEDAVKKLEEIARNNWTIGEIADQVELKYGEGTLQRLAEESGIEYKTLLNCRTIWRAWPESSRRREISWAVHGEFASQPDRAELIKQQKWTAKTAREEVQRRNSGPRQVNILAKEAEQRTKWCMGIKEQGGLIKVVSNPSEVTPSLSEMRRCAMMIVEWWEELGDLAKEAQTFLKQNGG